MAFDRWYLTYNGLHRGPFSTKVLLDVLASGQVAASEWVWPEGVDVSITVQQFLERVRAETLPGWMDAPPLPYTEGWYHIRSHEKCGPFARESLVALAAAGTLRPDELLWRHDASGWTSFAAKQVVAFPPPGCPWPSWLKETARAENIVLAAPLPASPGAPRQSAGRPDWMNDVTPPAKPTPPAVPLPDWMQEPSAAAPAPAAPPPAATSAPDWLADIRTIEESLRRQFIRTLANSGKAPPPGAAAPPIIAKPPVTPRPAGAAPAPNAAAPWPLSQDYNEAIQNPQQCFADPELRQGATVTNALGLPVPCAGNFADVYAVGTPTGKFAVKCFTRQIPGIRERYIEISKYLRQVRLPFLVDFAFLEQGTTIRGRWYPAIKMPWVEGVPLNLYVQQHLENLQTLETLGWIWLKLATRLRQANLAHGDLQHGNVLLVPGKRPGTFRVRLVDYDGMCVPALDLLKPLEVGHSAYQHPQRLKEGTYGLEIDRFAHLVIYTALRALLRAGRRLWDRYDNGDNLLFTREDFANPRTSPLFQELIKLGDAEVRNLAQALAIASQKPVETTPLLADLVAPGPLETSAPATESYSIGS